MAITSAGVQAAAAVASVANDIFGSDGDAARENRKQTEKLIKRRGQAARIGAERSGFNPLTYLAATAGTSVGGSMEGSGPGPLASTAAMLSSIGNAMYERETAEEMQERNHKSAMQQLEAINKAQAEAGGAGSVVTRTGAARLASNRAAQEVDPTFAGDVIDPRRGVDPAKVVNTPGANVIENDWTFGPVFLPGSEPPEADEAVLMAPIIIPQISRNVGEHVGNVLDRERWAADMADSIKRQKAWKERRAFNVGFNQAAADAYKARRDILQGY